MKFLVVAAFVTAALAAPYGVDAGLQCTPPSYICKPDFLGFLVCTTEGFYVDGGDCPVGTVCQYINNLPYCV
ncbi:hypothetical protein GGS26DRAFT_594243 [Hypomontagnella submonticulosa]|nr:hypothetical protein GGS26DRAFT_594243 [Hypomontagnella submonticulosa]